MKKYLFLMLALAGIMFSFVSCSSDDDDLTSLQSTIWVSHDDGDGLRTLTFGEKDFYVTISKKGNTQIDRGNYIWDPPIVRFSYTDRKTKKLETAIGKVEGNKLKINEIVYTKQ